MVPEFTAENLAQLQAEDSEIGAAYRVLQEGLDPSPDVLRGFPLESRALLSLQPEVRMEGDVLVKGQHETSRLVVPTALRYRLFQMTHAGPTAAHLGPLRITLQLRQSYYWRGMKRDVENWYRKCDNCARGKVPPFRPHGHLQKIQVGAPLDLVTMDILSGLPTATDGSKYVLVVVDAFTKWVEAYALPDQEASTCMTAAYNGFFARFGLPRQLHSDQGRNFESALVRELCSLSGVHKTRTTPFHPRSYGLTERANRTLLQMLRAVTDDYPQEWPSKIPTLLAAYRMSVHSTTNTTPNYAMLGREVMMSCSFIAVPPHDTEPNTDFTTELRNNLREADNRIREALHTSARTEKRYFDRRVRYQPFKVDQLVWLYWPRPLVRSSHRKLVKLWTGPWRILRFESPLVVQIKHTVSHKKQTVHVDRLMPYRASESVQDEEPTTNNSPDEHQNTENNPAEYSQSQLFFPSQSFPQSQSLSETQSSSQSTRFRREIRRSARYL